MYTPYTATFNQSIRFSIWMKKKKPRLLSWIIFIYLLSGFVVVELFLVVVFFYLRSNVCRKFLNYKLIFDLISFWPSLCACLFGYYVRMSNGFLFCWLPFCERIFSGAGVKLIHFDFVAWNDLVCVCACVCAWVWILSVYNRF